MKSYALCILQTDYFLRPWIGYPYLRSVEIALYIWITRSCFYLQYFTAEPVHDSVFKVLSILSHRDEERRKGKG